MSSLDAMAHGCAGDGITDDTVALNVLLATGQSVYLSKPPVAYLVTSDLICSTSGQIIYGDGRNESVILIKSPAGFSKGVFRVALPEPGPQWRDIGIKFTQPDTSARASLTTYVPAIYTPSMPRFRIERCRISQATIGVNMLGNCGGAVIDDLELSAYTCGIQIDGCEDTVRIDKLQCWPFDMTAANQEIFFDPGTTGIIVGRCDGLEITDACFICGTQAVFNLGADGAAPFVFIENTDFDSFNGLTVNAGTILVSNSFFSLVTTGAYGAVRQTGGEINLSNCQVLAGTLAQSPITMSGSNWAMLKILGGRLINGGQDVPMINLTGSNHTCDVSHAHFDTAISGAFANPIINAHPGTRLTAVGNRINDKGANPATWFNVQVDDWHRIIGNASVGWGNHFPTPGAGVYQWN